MADTKTHLKIAHRDGVLRVRPFTEAHLTGLKMAQRLPAISQVNVLMEILYQVLGEDTYAQVTMEVARAELDLTGLSALLNDVVEATTAYNKAKGTEDSE